MGQSVKLIGSGKLAMERVSQVIKLAQPVIVPSALGPVQLRPGTIWSGNKMLILVQGSTTYSTIDDRLYEWSTSDFIREEWLQAQQRAMKSAEGWVVVAQVEMALLCGIFVPWYVLLGVSCAKLGLFYADNKKDMDQAVSVGWKVLERLNKYRRDYPTYYRFLRNRVLRELWKELGNGVTAEDVAFLIGRIIQGATSTPELTMVAFLRIVAKCSFLVTLTHSPSIMLHAAESSAKKHAEDLEAFVRSMGYTVTPDEAREIMRELRTNAMSARDLKGMETDLQALLPSLERLRKAEKQWH